MNMQLNQSLFFLVTISIFEIWADVEEDCKTGLIAGETDFKDETFPSLAKIVDCKTSVFICSAVILTKNQLLTGKLAII